MRAVVVVTVLGLATSATAAERDPWWGLDKGLHLAAGTGLSAFGYKVAADGTGDRRVRLVVGAAVALGAGAAKELLDLAGFGTPSWKDFAWDAVGCAVGLLLALAVDLAVERFFGLHPRAPQPSEG